MSVTEHGGLTTEPRRPQGHHDGFPWKNVIGYLMSMVLTVAALWTVLAQPAQVGVILFVILGLAVVQIFVQLFFFMHFLERDEGPAFHAMGLALGLIFTIAIVAGSMWIMTFNSLAS